MITKAIFKVVERMNLSEAEMMEVFEEIMDGKTTPAQIASLITALSMKGETVDEIAGAARCMRQKATGIPLHSKAEVLDTCGTGGDNRNTFNISTAVAFVASAAGVRVAKHGNRYISSNCGSADVMEQLGIKVSLKPDEIARCIDTIGMGFLFAPNLHGAMKHALAPRKEIGIRTIFNMLGPLTNPAGATMQILGVYDGRMTEMFARVLHRLGTRRALVVHGLDGLDEITICAESIISELKNGVVTTSRIHPMDCGLPMRDLQDIKGGTANENAEIISKVLKGEKGPHREIVLINAGAALMVAGTAGSLKDGMKMAVEAIDSGLALNKLKQLKELSNSF
ncbi:MAG: anthranilate phosphoribosyltransferase [Proteobacteria bacterium]|nr:anthranilate phosphoribosyltransferase [Pseudomonadota bacterium]